MLHRFCYCVGLLSRDSMARPGNVLTGRLETGIVRVGIVTRFSCYAGQFCPTLPIDA